MHYHSRVTKLTPLLCQDVALLARTLKDTPFGMSEPSRLRMVDLV